MTRLDAAVILLILGSGLAFLHTTLSGDQYLYLIGAEKISRHGVMYRDFWDLKQPLIFFIYSVAGTLFGFGAFGVHLFDALYQTVFAVVLIVALRPHVRYGWTASVAPVLAIGPYYAFSTTDALASAEAFAGLPLFVAAVCAAEAFGGGRSAPVKAVAAGVAGAVAVTLKFAYLPILLAVWLVAAVLQRRERDAVLRGAALVAIGFIGPVALLAGYFALAGVLDIVWRTTFVDPIVIARHLAPEARSPILIETKTFIRATWPLVVLAVAAAVIVFRRRADVLGLQMVAWTLAGIAIIVLQSWSFYYKFFIIVAPLGILAAISLEALWTVSRDYSRLRKVGAATAIALMVGSSALAAFQMHQVRSNTIDDVRIASSLAYLNRAAARPGAIFVFGDPGVYVKSGRDQAVAMNGYSPHLLLPSQWRELRNELAAATPVYIVLEHGGSVPREKVVSKSPAIVALLASRYRIAFASPETTMYELR